MENNDQRAFEELTAGAAKCLKERHRRAPGTQRHYLVLWNRIRRYMDRFGVEAVETFIDACLSIEDLIDIHSPFIQRYDKTDRYKFRENVEENDEDLQPSRFRAKNYMEPYVNPPEVLAREKQERQKQEAEVAEAPQVIFLSAL